MTREEMLEYFASDIEDWPRDMMVTVLKKVTKEKFNARYTDEQLESLILADKEINTPNGVN